MTADEKTFIAFLSNKTLETWGEGQRPYMLSSIAVDFKAVEGDYKEVIGQERLKVAVSRLSEGSDFKVIEHPFQRAKIGLVPKDVEFEFQEITQVNGKSSDRGRGIEQRHRAVLNFFKVLGELSPEDLDGVVIPARVLVKLLKDK